MKKSLIVALTLAVAGALIPDVFAQQVPPPAAGEDDDPIPMPMPMPMPVPHMRFHYGPSERGSRRTESRIEKQAQRAFQQSQMHTRATDLAQAYIKANKESEKKESRQKLTDALNQLFDERMQQQQEDLAELEKQVADLRTIVKKRDGAKATIIDRRIEQLVQDAEGLGWSAPGKKSDEANLARAYVKAGKAAEKKAIREKLTDALSQLFDGRAKEQQQELEELEKEVSDLRALLQKRSGAKATIVDRGIEQMIQDAEGLGWSNQ
jgi:archaellum component FlaC